MRVPVTDRARDARSAVAVTLDMDWAPDFMVDWVAGRLAAHGVKATWFVTHRSAAVDRLRERPDLFELGIHPNFRAGSTHGASAEEVLRHCMAVVPDARAMRTHALVQSSDILALARSLTPVRADVSLFLPHHPGLRPVRQHTGCGALLRIPFFWEDDVEMMEPVPDWEGRSLADGAPGIKVFNFHPIHVYLNSPDMAAYCRLKGEVPDMLDLTEGVARRHRHPGLGTGTAFESVLAHLARRCGGWTVTEIADAWTAPAAAAGAGSVAP